MPPAETRQSAVAKRGDDADEPAHVRMGLRAGESVTEGNDFYGTQKTQAARIGKGGLTVELKDLGTQRVFSAVWEQQRRS